MVLKGLSSLINVYMQEEEFAYYRDLGRRIKLYRQAAGLSGTELGKRVGFSRAAISSIENGKQSISAYLVYKLLGENAMKKPPSFTLPETISVEGVTYRRG